jgi:hypothetical protein
VVAAGDVVYNNVHQFLAESADGGLAGGTARLMSWSPCGPRTWWPGTRTRPATTSRPPSRERDDAARLLAADPGREEFFFQVLRLYPERINPYTVWLTARRLLEDA